MDDEDELEMDSGDSPEANLRMISITLLYYVSYNT